MMDFHFSTWGYRIELTETGCRVTEWSEDLRPESALEFSKQMSGVDDREARNRQTMSETLERLAARRVCSDCGANYSTSDRPKRDWTCDFCGGDVIQRNPLMARLKEFEAEVGALEQVGQQRPLGRPEELLQHAREEEDRVGHPQPQRMRRQRLRSRGTRSRRRSTSPPPPGRRKPPSAAALRTIDPSAGLPAATRSSGVSMP